MSSREDEDDALVARVARGDETACRRLLDRHLGPVVAFAARILGDAVEAEDVAQESFLALWRRASRWRPGEARVSTWLHRVAKNACIDRLRRRREVALEVAGDPRDPMVDPGADPGAEFERRERAAIVAGAIAVLPERQRIALVLAYYQDLGNIEAAAVMEIGVEALESLLARARRRLREELASRRPELLGEP